MAILWNSIFVAVRKNTPLSFAQRNYRYLCSNPAINTAPFPGGITLSWSSATPAASTDTLKYLVYYAIADDNRPIVMSTECGLKTSALPYAAPLDDNKGVMSLTLSDNLKPTSYLFNVLVFDQNGQYALYTHVGPMKIAPSETPDGGSLPISWILGIGIPVFLITIVAIVYLVIRNRKLTKELEIEMHDFPKAVVRKAVRGPLEPEPAPNNEMKQNKKSDKKYSRLLTDDDEEEDYAPPDFLSNEI